MVCVRLKKFYVFLIALFLFSAALPQTAKTHKNEIVFEESVIEGKIRRPQVVLISADQRPRFKPMAINNFNDTTFSLNKINPVIFEQNRFEKAFEIGFKRP